MAESVIADGVASRSDLACDIRPFFHVAADQEECGKYLVLGQDLQDAQGVRIVGAVVVGQRKSLRSHWQSGKSPAEPLAGGRHGLVASGRGRNQTRSARKKAKHVAPIVTAPKSIHHRDTEAQRNAGLTFSSIASCPHSRYAAMRSSGSSKPHGQAFRASPLHCSGRS